MNSSNEKSHVTMEQHQCEVCLVVFDTGAILLDPRLRPVFGRTTITGHSLCSKCSDRRAADYVAFVEVEQPGADIKNGDLLSPDQVVRTGRIMHVRRAVVPMIFNAPIEDQEYMAFLEKEAFMKIMEIAERDGVSLQ